FDTVSGTLNVQGNLSLGNDRIVVVGSGQVAAGATASFAVDTSAGNDTALLGLNGAVAGNLGLNVSLGAGTAFLGRTPRAGNGNGRVSAFVDGGDGVDRTSINLAGAISGTINLGVVLGTGDDRAVVIAGGNLMSNANFSLRVNAGAGNDSAVLAWTGNIAA